MEKKILRSKQTGRRATYIHTNTYTGDTLVVNIVCKRRILTNKKETETKVKRKQKKNPCVLVKTYNTYIQNNTAYFPYFFIFALTKRKTQKAAAICDCNCDCCCCRRCCCGGDSAVGGASGRRRSPHLSRYVASRLVL